MVRTAVVSAGASDAALRAAWRQLAPVAPDRCVVTKIEDWNTPSRVAVGKAGFVETADMTLDREWGRSRVAVFPNGDGNGQLLAELINERPSDRPASGQPQSS